ncbi:hypothetical protein H0H93_003257 [Arthromyces matolae]|nr:hypothetical protein H0H93_003257 [Arthromyces matolae]
MSEDLATFKAQFNGDIVTSDDADYSKAIARWALNAQRLAKVVAFVKDAEDVRLAIRYAKEARLPIAIRGGGHSPAGSSSVEGGLVIDLSRYLNEAIVDADKRIVTVGGGALWETVDKEAIQQGLATVGGTVNHTGVGGLVLGGGYGWLSAEHGLAIDNLVQATVVTADGSILNANESENPDLFFGIRGGGSNFGVVTELVLRLHPQRKTVYAGPLIFAPPALEKLVDLTAKWWEGAGEKESMMQALTMGPDGKFVVVVILFYNGSEAEGRQNFQEFLNLGMNYVDIKALSLDVLLRACCRHDEGNPLRRAKCAPDAEAGSGEREGDSVPDKAKAAFGENYPRLQSIKKQYDPENIFNKWFPITPA